MDEIDALNMLLRIVGSSEVNTLTSTQPDAVDARNMLTRVLRREQRRGWWFNTDYNVTFKPDSQGLISLSESYSSIRGDGTVVIRDKKLYNNITNTFIFSADVTLNRVIRSLPWEQCAASFQEYVAYRTAVEYVRDELEDPVKEASLKEDAQRFYSEVYAEDLETNQTNMYTSRQAVKVRSGKRPYRRDINPSFLRLV